MSITDEQSEAIADDPLAALWDISVANAEDKLVDFIELMWTAVEPVRPFVRGWVVDAICDHLEGIHTGSIKKLLINVPPGFMKSLATSVFFPAWEWGPRNRPDLRYLCASYTQDLTVRDNVRTRWVFENEIYQRAWGGRFCLTSDQNSKMKFINDALGMKMATSVRGVGTGERADRIIVDDPHNVLEGESDAKREEALQWFTEVMPTRINDPKNFSVIVIMQRVHEADVSGLILEKDLGYTHLCVPMHYDPNHPNIDKKRQWPGWCGDPRKNLDDLAFPERYGEAEIADLIKPMMAWGGTYAVAGQLEQRPEPRGGGMIKTDWFEIVDELPAGPKISCRGWDFASTEGGDGAGSASVRMHEWWENGQSELGIDDVWWERVSPGGLYVQIGMTLKDDGYDVFQSLPQDPGQAGKYQVNDLLDIFAGYDFNFSTESGDKVVRFRPWAAQAETRAKVGRKIKLKRGVWNDVFLDHVSKFPMGRYKDIPDGCSRAYGGIVQRGGGEFLIGGSTVLHRAGGSS